MVKEFTNEDDALLAELGIEVETKKVAKRTPREERIIAGFEEIQNFIEEHGSVPEHGEVKDIFERLYAVRLDRIRALEECRNLVEEMDHQGLLGEIEKASELVLDDLDDDDILSALGVEVDANPITELKHVRSTSEKKAAEVVGNRIKCEDFDDYKHLFEGIDRDLKQKNRHTNPIRKDAGFSKTYIKVGNFFILGGLVAYVAKVFDETFAPNGDKDARLRLIFSNGTESSMLLRSLQRRLYEDDTSRIITEVDSAGPLFSSETIEGDEASGTIYVLKSKSTNPMVAENRELVHKIGVTGTSMRQRLSGANQQPTFLMADVEIVAEYELYNINRMKLENLLHRIFDSARLDIEIKDRFGKPTVPKEWYLVPFFIIEEAIEKIKDGTISSVIYNPKTVSFENR